MTPHCPLCKAELDGLRCAACEVTYPAPFGIPMLLPKADAQLAESFIDAVRDEKRVADLGEAYRTAGFEERAASELGNRAFFEQMAAALEPETDARRLAEAAILARATPGPPPDYSDPIPYALRDWAGLEVAEAELARLDLRIRRVLPLRAEGTRAVVLGAGTGRTAANLRDQFTEILAVDRSFAMAYAYERVHRDGLTLWENHLQAEGPQRLWPRQLAPSPAPSQPSGRVSFWVADASSLPLPDASIDVVCCFYFLDVIRLSALAREVRRVLRPGGCLVNLGPLVYHHHDFDEHLEPDRIRALLKSFDLSIDPSSEAWAFEPHLVLRPNAIRPVSHRAWSFRADFAPRSVDRTSTLRPRAPFTTTVTREAGSVTITVLSAGKKLEVETVQADLLELLDGVRTVASCLELLAERYTIEPDDEKALIFELGRLRSLGLIELV